MTNKLRAAVLFLALSGGAAACGDGRPLPAAPTSSPPSTQPPGAPQSNGLRLFIEPSTGFSTTDVRDVQDEIVQFSTKGELIWTADGTTLPGYFALDVQIPCVPCDGWLEVRFGTEDGERRAYLTVDYGHDNPGTVVDLEMTAGILVVRRTATYPPGTYTLSGTVTEVTSGAVVPVADAGVSRAYGSGWQAATTDATGFYAIHGLYDRTDAVAVFKEGYQTQETTVAVAGDTRFDVRLVRVPSAGAGTVAR
jgi:hypothetical protein